MYEVKKILCPIEFEGEFNEEILNAAVTMAKKFDAELVLIHVNLVFNRYNRGGVVGETLAQLNKSLLATSQEAMKELLEEESVKGIKVKGIVVDGDAATEITRVAKEEKIDLIVMGTHGKNVAEKFFFGSVAQKVIQGVAIPVMTIKPS